jgi:hypothetical protein
MTSRLSFYAFSILLVVCTVLTATSAVRLPENVAVHFNAQGAADGWVSRDEYRTGILLFMIGLPSFLVWTMGWLPKLTGGKGQIPDHEYWFASERRGATEQFLVGHACWLGALTVATVYGIHLALQRANAVTPATLATDQLSTMLLIFICGLGWWITSFLRHFRRR